MFFSPFSWLTLLTLLTFLKHSESEPTWNYDNQNDWSKISPLCNGNHQSPINIDNFVIDENYCQKGLKWYLNLDYSSFKIINNGYTVKISTFHSKNKANNMTVSKLVITNNMLSKNNPNNNININNNDNNNNNKQYCFDSIEFHWGLNSKNGSEHSIKGILFPMEMQLIHFDCNYNNITDAINHSNDNNYVIAIISIFLNIGIPNIAIDEIFDDNNNETLLDEVLFHSLDDNTNNNLNEYMVKFSMNELLPFYNKDMIRNVRYFNYKGSLTKPDCNPIVIWNILEHTITISENQLEIFRSILNYNNQKITPNYRHLQNNENGVVYGCGYDRIDDDNYDKNHDINKKNEMEINSIIVIVGCAVVVLVLITVALCIFYCSEKFKEKKQHRKKLIRNYDENNNNNNKHHYSEQAPMIEMNAN